MGPRSSVRCAVAYEQRDERADAARLRDVQSVGGVLGEREQRVHVDDVRVALRAALGRHVNEHHVAARRSRLRHGTQ